MDVEGQMVQNYPSCRKAMKLMLFLLHMATLDISILLKKYTTNQNWKGKGYAFKDFIPACVQKMMEAAEVEDEKDSADNE
jgi:Holliday junction resolvasome RuvABC endonuclease subunit